MYCIDVIGLWFSKFFLNWLERYWQFVNKFRFVQHFHRWFIFSMVKFKYDGTFELSVFLIEMDCVATGSARDIISTSKCCFWFVSTFVMLASRWRPSFVFLILSDIPRKIQMPGNVPVHCNGIGSVDIDCHNGPRIYWNVRTENGRFGVFGRDMFLQSWW